MTISLASRGKQTDSKMWDLAGNYAQEFNKAEFSWIATPRAPVLSAVIFLKIFEQLICALEIIFASSC